MTVDDLLVALSGSGPEGVVLTGASPAAVESAMHRKLIIRQAGRLRLSPRGRERVAALLDAPRPDQIKGVPMRPTITTQHRG